MSAATARRGIAWSIWTKSKASACLLASTPSVSVAPGLTETEGVLASKHAEAFDFVQMLQAIPRRAVAADIAPAVAFLASEEAGWVTGQMIVADGGHTYN